MPKETIYHPLIEAVLKELDAKKNDEIKYSKNPILLSSGRVNLEIFELPTGELVLVNYPAEYYGDGSLIGKDTILIYPRSLKQKITELTKTIDEREKITAHRYDFD